MTFDSIVVGGGIIGLSIAWRAAQLGLSVCVVDRPGNEAAASQVAAGMLAPVTEANFGEQRLLRLNIESAARWPGVLTELSEISGIDLRGGPHSTLHTALNRDQAESLQRLFEFQHELGLEVGWLKSPELRKLEPALHPSARAAILAPRDGSVDPRKVLAALRVALGSESVSQVTEQVIAISSGSAPAVELENGETIKARFVVLAAGCRSAEIPGAPAQLARVLRPVKGQILRLRSRSPLLAHTVRTEEVYIVARPGGEVVVGATVEEMGFDTQVTAGGVLELLRAADEAVPGLRELELTECSAGLRPGSADNAPLLGCSSEPGVILAVGHFRNGILQAPVTADGIAHLMLTGVAPDEFAGFEPGRFGC